MLPCVAGDRSDVRGGAGRVLGIERRRGPDEPQLIIALGTVTPIEPDDHAPERRPSGEPARGSSWARRSPAA